MLVAGSDEAIAPALLEQIPPFTWLTGADKYFSDLAPVSSETVVLKFAVI